MLLLTMGNIQMEFGGSRKRGKNRNILSII